MERNPDLGPADNANAALSQVLKDEYLLRLIFQHLNAQDSDEDSDELDLDPWRDSSDQNLNEFGELEETTNISRDTGGKSSLFKTSLTCKAFLEPALDTLWESLDSLLPLLNLLPSFILVDRKYSLTGQISSNDWARFNVYARRIRTLTYNTSDPPFPTYLYPRLLQCHPSPLLPALRRVNFLSTNGPSVDFAGLFVLISSSLSTICLGVLAHDKGPIEAFLSSLATAETPLKKVLYTGYASTNILMSFIQFKYLENLSVGIQFALISSEFFFMLDTLEHLTTLKLIVQSTTVDAFPNPTFDIGRQRRAGPASLKSLYVEGIPTHLALILSAVAVNRLECVTISVVHETVIETCPATLALCFNSLSLSNSLRDVFFTHHPWSFHGSSCNLKFSTLSPLWRSHSLLKTLKVDHAQLSIQNDDLKRLAMSSPNLKILELEAEEKVAFTSLSIFAQFCPSLQLLKLPLDSNAPTVELDDNQSEHQLETLFIFSDAAKCEKVDTSRYVDRLFPYLKYFQEDSLDEDWKQIRRLLKVYQDIRRDSVGLLQGRAALSVTTY